MDSFRWPVSAALQLVGIKDSHMGDVEVCGFPSFGEFGRLIHVNFGKSSLLTRFENPPCQSR